MSNSIRLAAGSMAVRGEEHEKALNSYRVCISRQVRS